MGVLELFEIRVVGLFEENLEGVIQEDVVVFGVLQPRRVDEAVVALHSI